MRHELNFKTIDKFSQSVIDALDFTRDSEEKFYDVVDLDDFKDDDADKIFRCLKNELRLIPFGDYLKRYIYIKAGMTGDYKAIDIKEYQRIIIDSFNENNTPKSFTETSAKLSALAKNWLTQVSINRQIVFLLGFGLNMELKDVSTFLVNAQRERDFNFKDPNEIIYWYCFKNGYNCQKAIQLKKIYDDLPATGDGTIYGDMTKGVRDTIQGIKDESTLLKYLSIFKSKNKKDLFSITAYKRFSELYLKCKEIIANYYNSDEDEKLENEIDDYRTKTKNSEKLSENDKNVQIQKMRAARKVWQADEITESDVEKILCCGMPTDDNGNLLKLSASKLSKHFDNKRPSRQHIREVLIKEVPVDRFDLITLNFFILSQDENLINNKLRYSAFIASTNNILDECAMGELYVANPYECFLLMCILSDGPLATYADVCAKSFEKTL